MIGSPPSNDVIGREMPNPIIVSREKLQMENSLLQFACFSDTL